MGSVKSTDTLDLETATLVTEGVFGKGKVRCESFVAAGEDVFVVTGISSADDKWVVRVMVHKEKTVFPREAKASADGFYVRRSTLNLLPKGDPRGWTTNATAAVSALGAVVTKPSATDDEGRATVKIRANKPFALFFFSDPARHFTWGKPLH